MVPRAAISGDAGLILRTQSSVLFVIPWGGHWIIGTTDTDWRLDRAHPAASAKDIEYLLGQVNTVLDRPLSTSDIEGVFAGLRPLLSGEDESTSALSRQHAVVEPMLGLMLVAGGKLTTYRVMAADVVDRAVRRLGATAVPGSRTDELPLLGADGYLRMRRDPAALALRSGISVDVAEHLLDRYGSLRRTCWHWFVSGPSCADRWLARRPTWRPRWPTRPKPRPRCISRMRLLAVPESLSRPRTGESTAPRTPRG